MPRKKAPCDPRKVETFDYSPLSPDFHALAKPAQRALVNSGLCTPERLAKLTRKEVLALHGIGPTALPILAGALRKRKLAFRED